MNENLLKNFFYLPAVSLLGFVLGIFLIFCLAIIFPVDNVLYTIMIVTTLILVVSFFSRNYRSNFLDILLISSMLTIFILFILFGTDYGRNYIYHFGKIICPTLGFHIGCGYN